MKQVLCFLAVIGVQTLFAEDLTISNAEEFGDFRDRVNDGEDFEGYEIVLANDIALTGDWTPIGDNASQFKGVFDGQGYAISGLSVSGFRYAGLFGYVGDGGQIKNVNVVASEIRGTQCAGGLAAAYASGETIENCGIEADSIVAYRTNGSVTVGGLIGDVIKALTIANSYVIANVLGNSNTYASVGGLVGYVNTDLTITNSYANGDVFVNTVNNRADAGGLMGAVSNVATELNISNSYASGDVNANSYYADANSGGLVGWTQNSSLEITITNSYATGNVEVKSDLGNGSSNSGGLAGWIGTNIIIENSYATGNVLSNTNSANINNSRSGGLVGAVSGNATKLNISNSYASGDVEANAENGDAHSGGLTGYVKDLESNVINSYVSGNVKANATRWSNPGGIFARYTTGTVASVYYKAQDGLEANVSGSGTLNTSDHSKPEQELRNQGTFAGWDFAGVWGIDSEINNGYPYLLVATDSIKYSGAASAKYGVPFILTGKVFPEKAKKDIDWSISEDENNIAESISGNIITFNKLGEVCIKANAASISDETFTDEICINVEKGDGIGSVSMENWVYSETSKEPVSISGTNGTDNVAYAYAGMGSTSYNSGDIPTTAGTYKVTAKFAETDYYNEFEAEAEFTISKAAQSFQIASQESKTYGDDLPKPSLSGIKESEEATATYLYKPLDSPESGYSEEEPINIGFYTVKAVISETSNYSEGSQTANFQIRPATLTITPKEGQTKISLDTDKLELEYTAAGLVEGDIITGSLKYEGQGGLSGEYPGTYDFDISDLSAGSNYILVLDNTNKFTVIKDGEIIVKQSDIIYGAKPNPLDEGSSTTFNLGSLIFAYKLKDSEEEYSAAIPEAVGEYSLSGCVSKYCNYTVFRINPIPIDTIAILPIRDQKHTGEQIFPQIFVAVNYQSKISRLLKASEDYSVEYAGNTEIGTATVTITGINGYAGYAATANFQITENGFTPILNTPLATSHSPPAAYYTLTGKPLGNAKPKAPGIYIEKKGHETRKMAVR